MLQYKPRGTAMTDRGQRRVHAWPGAADEARLILLDICCPTGRHLRLRNSHRQPATKKIPVIFMSALPAT